MARVAMIREDAKANLISPDTYQRAMSDAGIDMPLTDEDADYARFAQHKAMSVLAGEDTRRSRSVHEVRICSARSGVLWSIEDDDDAARARLTGGDRIADVERRHGRGSAQSMAQGTQAPDGRCGIGWYRGGPDDGVDQIFGALQAPGRWRRVWNR